MYNMLQFVFVSIFLFDNICLLSISLSEKRYYMSFNYLVCSLFKKYRLIETYRAE